MDRRTFLQTGAAGLALSAAPRGGAAGYGFDEGKAQRVGLIGCGWYGKSDLLRLIQVAPVEVVSLCDVDKNMLAAAAELVATRQASKKKPRTFGDYRQMLAEKDLDIVLVGTPDHWHSLPMIAACEAGADVYCQKPISVDVVEGQAMVAAARKHKRVVQVGTQRRSTPHLVEARDRVIKEGRLGTLGLVEIYCYYHMRARENPPDEKPPEYLDYETWTGPAPMRPYNQLVHAGRGLRLRRPPGGLAAPHLRLLARPEVPLGRDLLRRQGHPQGERQRLRLHPGRQGAADPVRQAADGDGQVPRGQDREGHRDPRRLGQPTPPAGLPPGG